MSDLSAEKMVAELRASATKLEKTFKVAPPLKLDQSELMRRAADLIAHQAARLEEVTRERDEARKQRDREGRAHLATIDQRDNAEAWADKLARAAGGDTIGEHSNLNNPWANALEALTAAEAEVGRLRAALEVADKAAEAGMCQFSAQSKHLFLSDVRQAVADVGVQGGLTPRACLSSKKEG